MATKTPRTIKKVQVKGTVVPQPKTRTKSIDPNKKWEQMKEDFDLDDDEIPPYLAEEIRAFNNRPKAKSGLSRTAPNKPLTRILTAESVLHSLQFPARPMKVAKCKLSSCGDVFRTPYNSVAYCSDFCRMEGLKEIGIDGEDIFGSKNELELWGGYTPPAIIPEAVLAVMKYLVLDSEARAEKEIQPWSPNHPKKVSSGIRPSASIPQARISPIPPRESSDSQESLRDRLARMRAKNGLDN